MRTRFIYAICLLLLIPALAGAFQPKNNKSDLNSKEFFLPELYISSSHVSFESVATQLTTRSAWNSFFAKNGSEFQVYFDPRSEVPVNIIGHIPMIPGNGVDNKVTLGSIGATLGKPVSSITPEIVGGVFLKFLRDNRSAIAIDLTQLGEPRVTKINDDLWHISIPQQLNGIPVRWGRFLGAISHGNLVIVGGENWNNVKIDTKPSIPADHALALGFGYIGGRTDQDKIWKNPVLEIIPVAPQKFQTAAGYSGPIGQGLEHRLAWVFGFQRASDQGLWEMSVDAHTGEVLELADKNHYIDKKFVGNTYPLTDTGICPSNDRCGQMVNGSPMPFADTGLPFPNDFTNSAGHFDYTSGTVTTTLSGKFVDLTDTCGPINVTSGTGDIDLGGTNGDHDCTVPAPGGVTSAVRSGMYELNKIFEEARGYLPGNPWLNGTQTGPLPSNMNITQTCNAFYSPGDPGSVNFYRSGGGCNNTGEIAAVFDHEWGHGMDDHDSAGALSNSSEGYADIASMYRLWASCVGYGFFQAGNQSGCGDTADGTGSNNDEAQTGAAHCDTDCSGVRDSDWAKHFDNLPDTVSFVCASCLTGGGPCGRQVHCAATPVRQAAWDFVARDLTSAPFNYDNNTAFIVGDRTFYLGSGNVGAWNSCTCPGTSDGCAAANGYMGWLVADDDNGLLSDGTPHMTAIFAAFNRHGIACATPTPQNSGCGGGPTTAPVITAAPGSNQVTLTWAAVPNAVSYNVFRSEGFAACDFGKVLVGNTVSTSFTDTNVGNDRAYSYVVMAVGSNPSCYSPASACVTAMPAPCAGAVNLDSTSYACSDSISIHLRDSDLVGAGTTTVNVFSNTEVTPEVVTLNETPAGSGQFDGSIATTSAPPTPGNGILSVSNGDTITVRYHDASFCGPAQDVDATAGADCLAPSISNVAVINITDSSATVTWNTNENANSRTTYAVAPGPPSINVDDLTNYVTNHSTPIPGLTTCTDYVFTLTSSDLAGNSVTDSNGGSFYNFTTFGSIPIFNDDVEAGGANWTAGGTAGTIFHIDTCSANSPTHAWKAGASAACPGAYGNNATTTLVSNATYSIVAGTRLQFAENYTTESGFDFCRPQVSTNGGTSWTDLDSYSGSSGGWHNKVYDLSAFAGSNALIRFQFTTDVSVTAEGWYIDDIQIIQPAPCTAFPQVDQTAITDDCSQGGPGDNDGVLDPGESAVMQVTTRNAGLQSATGISGHLTTSTPGVVITDADATFPDLAPNATGVSDPPHFSFNVGPGVGCGSVINFHMTYTTNQGSFDDDFTVQVGAAVQGTNTYDSIDVPKTILDMATVESNLDIADTNTIVDVNVKVNITHTFDGDIDMFLVGPGGAPVIELSTDNGGTGENFADTIFDDQAATSITAGAAPFAGSFKPEGLLSVLNGMPANGTWKLRITDDANVDTGTLNSWSLQITTNSGFACNNCGGVCPTITLSPGTLPNGTAGAAYNQVITASGGTSPYIFAVTAGTLPTGLTLATDGTLSGTPTATGTFNFTITATDFGGCTGSMAYSVTIDCGSITISPSTLPDGAIGVAYNQSVSGSGGLAPYTFAVTAGTLPTGLSMDTAGNITGTPTAQGSFNFTITATDSAGCTGSQAYTINISCAAIVISPATLPGGVIGIAYSQTLTGSGGAAPYTFAVTTGALPDGLSMDAAGNITGTPTTAGSFNFTVTATDNNGCTGTQSYTIDISCAAISISPSTLPDGTIGVAYSQTLTGSGGAAPYTFAVTTGALPDGLSMDTAGNITGTPTTAASFNFTVTATDNNGCTGTQSYTVNIVLGCLFCDFFDDVTLASNWLYSPSSAAWSEVAGNNGSLVGDGTAKKASTLATPAFTPGCSTCYVESTMQSTANGRVWLFGWYLDKKNHVELLMKEQGDKWILKEKVNGTTFRMKGSATIDPNVLYRARVTFTGTQFDVTIDGTPLFSMPSHGAHSGTVGYQVKKGTGTFGEIIVN